MNTKRGLNNIIYGILSQAVTLGLGLIIPRLVLVNLGSEANGLLHSISTVFTYLTLLEAGVGKATSQALYKPLSEDNRNKINSIMSATNRFYRKTGYIYSAAVIIFAVVYCLFVKTSLSKAVVFSVIVLTGASSVLSYFVQGKYTVFMGAEGRGYVLTNFSTVTTVLASVGKIALLVYGFGVVEIQGMYLFFSVLQMLFVVYYIRRNYEWLSVKAKPDYEAISQKNYVLLHQITGMIFDNTDILLLTVMSGLKTVSVYSMYTTFYTVIKSVLNTVSYSYSYALGRIFHSDKEEFKRLHNIYELYNMSLTFALMCILNMFILPFMKIYTADVTDINYIDKYIPMLFTTVYLLSNGRASSGLVIDFAQHFEQTKWRAVLESAINIGVSVVAIHFLGIYGALIGTIAALLYRANDMIIYANRLLGRSPWITYKRWLVNLVLFLGLTFVMNAVFPEINALLPLVIYAGVSTAIVVPAFIAVNSVCELKTAKYAVSLLKKVLKNKGDTV